MSNFGQPPGGGFGQPPAGGGGFGQPPAGGGGFGQPPAGGGGFGQPPAGGGGFGQPPGGGFGQPPGGGGFGQPPAGGGGFGQPPAGGGGGFGPPSGMASGKVVAPALTMMITNGLGILFALIGIVMNVLGTGMGTFGGGGELSALTSGAIGIATNILGIIVGAFCIFGLMKMKQAQSWGMSLAAVILSMIPCLGPCWCLNIFIGIWGLIVLLNQEVKQSFT